MFSLGHDGYFPYTVKCPLLFKAEVCSRITVEVEVKESGGGGEGQRVK